MNQRVRQQNDSVAAERNSDFFRISAFGIHVSEAVGRFATRLLLGLLCTLACTELAGAAPALRSSTAGAHFRKNVRPILENYCFDCHADGANKGGVAFDEFKSDDALVGKHDLWLAVLKNTRAGL